MLDWTRNYWAASGQLIIFLSRGFTSWIDYEIRSKSLGVISRIQSLNMYELWEAKNWSNKQRGPWTETKMKGIYFLSNAYKPLLRTRNKDSENRKPCFPWNWNRWPDPDLKKSSNKDKLFTEQSWFSQAT